MNGILRRKDEELVACVSEPASRIEEGEVSFGESWRMEGVSWRGGGGLLSRGCPLLLTPTPSDRALLP